MKRFFTSLVILTLAILTVSLTFNDEAVNPYNLKTGNPEIASINQLDFGPDGILFIGDSKNAAVYALDTEDSNIMAEGPEINIEGLDKKIAASLGTTVDNIEINDMAVNPNSKKVYFGVTTSSGNVALLRLNGEKFESVDLSDVKHSKMALENPVATDAKDRSDRPLRVWAISDLKFHDGKVLVSGLSNKEFGSTFRSIPFPFNDKQDHSTLEIYHAAHGQYETEAPIKAFDVITMEGQDYLMASYTCTPLVLFPLNELKDGKHNKGRTVAELGSGNSPLDMISIKKDGEQYFLMSNTNRPVMRIKYDDIASFEQSLTTPVEEFAKTEGVNYINVPMVHILQLDNYDDNQVVYVQRTADGDLILRTRPSKWI
ncbi:MAG: hypothetical protein R3213_05755 [Flavobacteriaceae bacterium]|nr:hypothetical protein [Flavobacteriaceae bacterium]